MEAKLKSTNEIRKNTTQLLTVEADTSYTSAMMLCTGAKAIMKYAVLVVARVNEKSIIHLFGESSYTCLESTDPEL